MRALELLKEYHELGFYGGWVSNKNEIFGTDRAYDHLNTINQQGFASFERAFEAGWVRIIWQDDGWSLEGMPKDIKRTFRKIAKRFFMDAKDSGLIHFALRVVLLSDPMDRYTDNIEEYFTMPQEKTKLIQFMNGL